MTEFGEFGDFEIIRLDTEGGEELQQQLEDLVVPAVPDGCQGCAVQCELRNELGQLLVNKLFAQHFAQNLMGSAGEQIDELIEQRFPDSSDEAKHYARVALVGQLEAIDVAIAAKQAEIDDNATACSGVLRVQADKGNTTFTVEVCTSALQYADGPEGTTHHPAHIKTEPNEKP